MDAVFQQWRSKMKTLIAALALLTLVAGPVFAQSYIPRQDGYYQLTPDDPAWAGQGPGYEWRHR
jgi:hypothetical protein